MAVRNQHVRQSSSEVYKTINGQRYAFYPYSWDVSKAKLRYVATKAAQGKIALPSKAQEYYGIIHVFVKPDNTLATTEGN